VAEEGVEEEEVVGAAAEVGVEAEVDLLLRLMRRSPPM